MSNFDQFSGQTGRTDHIKNALKATLDPMFNPTNSFQDQRWANVQAQQESIARANQSPYAQPDNSPVEVGGVPMGRPELPPIKILGAKKQAPTLKEEYTGDRTLASTDGYQGRNDELVNNYLAGDEQTRRNGLLMDGQKDIDFRQSLMEKLQGRAEAYDERLAGKSTMDRMNLAPLMALADSETGSRLSQGYNAPMTQEQEMMLKQKLDQQMMSGSSGIMNSKLNLYNSTKVKTDNWKEKADYTHRLKKEIAGMKKAGTYKDSEHKASTFASRMKYAEENIASLVKDGFDPASFSGRFQNNLPGFMEGVKGDKAKQFQQAARDFIAATLREESGAAISEKEYEDGRKRYFPALGDGENVLAQKRESRRIILEGFKNEAGGAYTDLQARLSAGGTGGKVDAFMKANNIKDRNQAIKLLKSKGYDV